MRPEWLQIPMKYKPALTAGQLNVIDDYFNSVYLIW